MKILVTGGAGFIGSALVRHLIDATQYQVVNLDKLTYAANMSALSRVAANPRYRFEQVDVADGQSLKAIFDQYKPDAVMHLAAETHVDRSISGPEQFVQTNVVGTFCLLGAALAYWRELESEKQSAFRFLHVSTDEVFGDLSVDAAPSHEQSAYAPSSPYAASKASADHMVRAWSRTYGLPVLITYCSNNYGPWQNAEKLIPCMLQRALAGQSMPVYGDGQQIRDWLFVDDHVRALVAVLQRGKVGDAYCISGGCRVRNIDLVSRLCDILAELRPGDYYPLITHVDDRPGHDRCYALDSSKIRGELGWAPSETLSTGLRRTAAWYCERFDRAGS